jgi:prolycopene isomerase
VTSQGDRFQSKQVIANVSRTVVYNQLISPKSEVPEIGLRECNARVHGLSGFVVYLGLDATLEELGLNDYHYYLYTSMDDDAVYDSYGTLEAPHLQALLCMNKVIPDCSPPGTSVVSSTTLYRPEAWKDISPRDYVRVKNKIASDLITGIEEATGAPIREHIEEWEVATPQTLARYTSTYDGIMYGYEAEPWDSLMPRMMSMQEDRLIDGLEFAGGYAFRGHGFTSSTKSGQTAALLTWRDMLEKGVVQQ